MSTFEHKKVFHSALVSASPIRVKFGKVMDDQYKKGQRVCPFSVDGEDTSYWYQVENQRVEDEINALGNGWVTIQAAGSKGSATIAKAGAGSTPTQAAEVPQKSDTGLYGPSTIAEQFEECIQAVQNLYGEGVFGEDGFLTESASRMVNSLWIQWGRTGRRVPLYQGQPVESDYSAPEPDSAAVETEDRVGKEKRDALGEYLSGPSKLDWDGEAHDGSDRGVVRARIQQLAEETADVAAVSAGLSWCAEERQYQDNTHSLNKDVPF